MRDRQPSELEQLLSIDPGKELILPTVDLRDYSRLAQTCRGMFQFFKKDLSII